LMIGILGEYVGRIYEQVKIRPLYMVRDRVNLQREKDTDELDGEDDRGVDRPRYLEVTVGKAGGCRLRYHCV